MLEPTNQCTHLSENNRNPYINTGTNGLVQQTK